MVIVLPAEVTDSLIRLPSGAITWIRSVTGVTVSLKISVTSPGGELITPPASGVEPTSAAWAWAGLAGASSVRRPTMSSSGTRVSARAVRPWDLRGPPAASISVTRVSSYPAAERFNDTIRSWLRTPAPVRPPSRVT